MEQVLLARARGLAEAGVLAQAEEGAEWAVTGQAQGQEGLVSALHAEKKSNIKEEHPVII
ncbi:MAG: hypothetical protein KJ706_01425 [Candidatus Omnitrophica bacterium]|nr:hypothetical protein [Candidatus Omnitrophota bacterium]MBU4590499.1 hypothetical protein [Candidatus Omnitrophota bacterium]